jgi:hypothetical protein
MAQSVERKAGEHGVRRKKEVVGIPEEHCVVAVSDVTHDGSYGNLGVDPAHQSGEGRDLPTSTQGVKWRGSDYSGEVGPGDSIKVHYNDLSNTEMGQLLDQLGAATSGPDDSHPQAPQALLPGTIEEE